MHRSKRWRVNGLSVLVATVGIVFASAAPAAAANQGGSSTMIGWELGPDGSGCTGGPLFGFYFPTTYYSLTANDSTYLVRTSTGAIRTYFIGPVSMNAQHADMVAAPQAARPGTCDLNVVQPGQVPLTNAWVIDRDAASGGVDCDMPTGNGYYLRDQTSSFTIEFRVNCDITGNTSGFTGAVFDVPITHRLVGTQLPCSQLGGCGNPDAGSKLTGSYTLS